MRADPLEVEKVVGALRVAVTGQSGTGADLLSGVLTFTSRFVRAVIAVSPVSDRSGNARKVAEALREIAALVDMDDAQPPQVH